MKVTVIKGQTKNNNVTLFDSCQVNSKTNVLHVIIYSQVCNHLPTTSWRGKGVGGLKVSVCVLNNKHIR